MYEVLYSPANLLIPRDFYHRKWQLCLFLIPHGPEEDMTLLRSIPEGWNIVRHQCGRVLLWSLGVCLSVPPSPWPLPSLHIHLDCSQVSSYFLCPALFTAPLQFMLSSHRSSFWSLFLLPVISPHSCPVSPPLFCQFMFCSWSTLFILPVFSIYFSVIVLPPPGVSRPVDRHLLSIFHMLLTSRN